MNVAITYTSREEIEVYRFSPFATVLIPLLAILAQVFLPVKLRFFSVFDLPLLVTLFFAVARRSQVSGLVTGAVIGLLQDALTHQPLGLYGIAKTVVGYAASSLGVKIDVENPGSRLLIGFGFYWVHKAVYFLVARNIGGLSLEWRWLHTFGAALANGLFAIVMFAILDRYKQRT